MRDLALILAAAILLANPSGASAGGGGKKGEPSYIALRPLTLTIVRPTGKRGALTVEVGIDVADAAARERAAASGPLLRDAYITALQPYAMRLAPSAPPNVEYIAACLQRETDRVLGRKGAQVLLGAVLVN